MCFSFLEGKMNLEDNPLFSVCDVKKVLNNLVMRHSGVVELSPKTCKLGVRLVGDSKLPMGVNVCVDGCLSICVSPAMN